MMKAPLAKLTILCLVLLLSAAFPAFAAEPESVQPPNAELVADLDDDDQDAFLDSVSPIVADPLERWNRIMFRFNDIVLDNVARPLHQGYSYITPRFMRTGISNFFHNLLFPVRFTNNLLQGKGLAAGVEMSRFILNTTAGLGGFFDVAKNKKPVVPVDDEDMGQTFGVWGIGEGFYIVWPFLGPSTLRDSAGMVGDYFLDPVNYVRPNILSMGIHAGRTFNDIDQVLDMYDELNRTAVEPYSSFRDAYIQHRRAKVAK